MVKLLLGILLTFYHGISPFFKKQSICLLCICLLILAHFSSKILFTYRNDLKKFWLVETLSVNLIFHSTTSNFSSKFWLLFSKSTEKHMVWKCIVFTYRFLKSSSRDHSNIQFLTERSFRIPWNVCIYMAINLATTILRFYKNKYAFSSLLQYYVDKYSDFTTTEV